MGRPIKSLSIFDWKGMGRKNRKTETWVTFCHSNRSLCLLPLVASVELAFPRMYFKTSAIQRDRLILKRFFWWRLVTLVEGPRLSSTGQFPFFFFLVAGGLFVCCCSTVNCGD